MEKKGIDRWKSDSIAVLLSRSGVFIRSEADYVPQLCQNK
jgi:hypothetical protein